MSVPVSEHVVTYKAAFGYVAATIGAVIAAAWILKGEIGLIREDVAVIKYQVSQLSRTAAVETHETNQAQYLFVKLPLSETEMHDQRVRDVLIKQGLIDARTTP